MLKLTRVPFLESEVSFFISSLSPSAVPSGCELVSINHLRIIGDSLRSESEQTKWTNQLAECSSRQPFWRMTLELFRTNVGQISPT